MRARVFIDSQIWNGHKNKNLKSIFHLEILKHLKLIKIWKKNQFCCCLTVIDKKAKDRDLFSGLLIVWCLICSGQCHMITGRFSDWLQEHDWQESVFKSEFLIRVHFLFTFKGIPQRITTHGKDAAQKEVYDLDYHCIWRYFLYI